jgi:hypothetical protein
MRLGVVASPQAARSTSSPGSRFLVDTIVSAGEGAPISLVLNWSGFAR